MSDIDIWGLMDDVNSFIKQDHYSAAVERLFVEFEMGPKIEEYYKMRALKDLEFLQAAQRDMSEIFKKEMRFIISRDKNMINMVSGPQGGGKSALGIGLIYSYEQLRKEMLDQDVSHHFTFSPAQLQAKFPEAEDGDYIQSDEWPRMSGPNSRVILDKLANLIDQLRATHKCVNICTPEIVSVEGLSNLLVPFGHYKRYYETKKSEDMISRALWYHVDELQSSKKRFVLMGVIYITMDGTQEIWEEYSKLKMDNIKRLEQNRGGSGVGTEHFQFLDAIADEILAFAITKGYPKNPENPAKNILGTYTLMMGITGLSKRDEDIVQNLVVMKYEETHKQTKKPTQVSSLSFDLSQPFEVTEAIEDQWLEGIKSKSKSPKIDRNLRIYKKCTREPGMTYEKIIRDPEFSQDFKTKQRVDQIVKGFKGQISEIKGNLYELYILPQLELQYDKVIHMGGFGDPDFKLVKDGKIIFLSVKCLNFAGDFSLPYTEHRAEINAARKEQTQVAQVHVHLYNLYNKHIYLRSIEEELIIKPELKLKGRNHRIHVDKYDQ